MPSQKVVAAQLSPTGEEGGDPPFLVAQDHQAAGGVQGVLSAELRPGVGHAVEGPLDLDQRVVVDRVDVLGEQDPASKVDRAPSPLLADEDVHGDRPDQEREERRGGRDQELRVHRPEQPQGCDRQGPETGQATDPSGPACQVGVKDRGEGVRGQKEHDPRAAPGHDQDGGQDAHQPGHAVPRLAQTSKPVVDLRRSGGIVVLGGGPAVEAVRCDGRRPEQVLADVLGQSWVDDGTRPDDVLTHGDPL